MWTVQRVLTREWHVHPLLPHPCIGCNTFFPLSVFHPLSMTQETAAQTPILCPILFHHLPLLLTAPPLEYLPQWGKSHHCHQAFQRSQALKYMLSEFYLTPTSLFQTEVRIILCTFKAWSLWRLLCLVLLLADTKEIFDDNGALVPPCDKNLNCSLNISRKESGKEGL